MILLKSVFIIAIVAVAMIGVMVPSVFAETSVQETYDQDIQKLNKEALDKIEAEQTKPIPASPLGCEYGIPDEYCKHLISQKDADEELNKLNKLKKLIPDNYNILSSQIELDSSGIVKWRQISADAIRSDDMDDGGILLAQYDDNDSLLTAFKTLKNSVEYQENVSYLSATCVEGWHEEQWKTMLCLKDDMFIMTGNNFGESELVMKQILNKIDDTLSLPKIETSSDQGGGCLIATATYGSEMSQQVQQLRELRDNQLLQTKSGTAFMGTFNDIYYSFSPIIADYERENPYFKEAVKIAITPMISTLSLMENAESESEVLGLGLSVIVLNLGMYLGVPSIVIVGIRKKF